MEHIYLDYNATAPLRPEAKAAMLAVMGPPGNPSSVHQQGQAARAIVETAREHVAKLTDADPASVIFTSGGTEANWQALHGYPDRTIITTPVEHMAVLSAAPDALLVDVDAYGLIDCDHLEHLLKTYKDMALVSVMMANNETGVIQPLDQVIELAHAYGAIVHSDAVQSCGKGARNGFIGFEASGVDLLTVSAHKMGGATGIGALLVRDGVKIPPLIAGGGQESRRRGGTENLTGIASFGAAATAIIDNMTEISDHFDQLATWHKWLEDEITNAAPDAVIFGQGVKRLANTSAIAMPGRRAETQVMQFDLAGIAVSAGAACSSGKVANSHVLEAMKAGDLAQQTIRVSSGWNSKQSDFERFVEIWLQVYQKQV